MAARLHDRWTARTSDGAELSLRRLPVPGARARAVLTHGMCHNGRICWPLGRYLAERGIETWIFEWRGHGRSTRGPVETDFEHLAIHDVEAASARVLDATGEPAFWIGLSAGGILPLVHLARHPGHAHRFRGLVAIGSQVTHAAARPHRRLIMAAGWLCALLIPMRIHGRGMGYGPEDEWRRLMLQWLRWNLSGRWTGADGVDYLERLRGVELPALYLAGAADRTVAPPPGCRVIFDAIGGTDKTFVVCAENAGFSRDFDHADLLAGPAARDEVWPRIAAWIERRSAGLGSGYPASPRPGGSLREGADGGRDAS